MFTEDSGIQLAENLKFNRSHICSPQFHKPFLRSNCFPLPMGASAQLARPILCQRHHFDSVGLEDIWRRDRLLTLVFLASGPDGKESACEVKIRVLDPWVKDALRRSWQNPLQYFSYDFHSLVFLIPSPSEPPLTYPHPLSPNQTPSSWLYRQFSQTMPWGFLQQSDSFFQKNYFPIDGISAPSFKIKTFLSTITHTQLILISKIHISLWFQFPFLVLCGTEVIFSGVFFVCFYLCVSSK